jgi:hypothetical protein
MGNLAHRRVGWVRFILGRSRAPRAWDHLFASPNLTGWVIIHPKGDTPAIFGAWARTASGSQRSYAAGYPEEQDLFLIETMECDPDTGRAILDAAGKLQPRGISVLIRWDEVAYLEFIGA